MKKALTLIFLLSFLSSLCAQESKVTSDFLFWSGVGLKKEMNKWLDFEIEHEWRFNQNASDLYKKQTSIGFEFDLPKGFKTGIILRTKRDKNKEGVLKDKYSYLFDAKYKYKFQHFDISYRFRTELSRKKINDFSSFNEDLELRNRLKVDYELDALNLKPYISYELFLYKEDKFSKFQSNNNRYTLGFEFKLLKHNEIDVFYRIDQELVQYYPYTKYCIGITWQYEI